MIESPHLGSLAVLICVAIARVCVEKGADQRLDEFSSPYLLQRTQQKIGESSLPRPVITGIDGDDSLVGGQFEEVLVGHATHKLFLHSEAGSNDVLAKQSLLAAVRQVEHPNTLVYDWERENFSVGQPALRPI